MRPEVFFRNPELIHALTVNNKTPVPFSTTAADDRRLWALLGWAKDGTLAVKNEVTSREGDPHWLAAAMKSGELGDRIAPR